MKRGYASDPYGPQFGGLGGGAGGSRFAGATVTKWLLIALVVLFLVDIVGMGPSGEGDGRLMIHLSLGSESLMEVWRWLTYPFVNLDVGSWLFSVITLFVFGRLAEQSMGSRRYGVMLIITTLVGALVYAVLSKGNLSVLLTGAGGLSLAVLVVVAMMNPDQKVQLLIPPVPVKMKTLVFCLIGFLVVMAIARQADPAVSLGHLSGVGVGFLCMKNLHWLDIFGVGKNLKKSVKKKQKKVVQKGGMKARTKLNMGVSKREAEVNRILDKVSAEGIGNLTDEERDILKFASKK